MPFALEIEKLYKSFAEREVIQDLNLQLSRQQTLALIGPSGCGKSTLLNLICGLDTDYLGQIRSESKMLGYMLQKDLLLPWRNIAQNVFLPRELKHLETRPRSEIDKLFLLFGLENFRKAYPRELSGGMRQRANLLRTYTLQSDLLLLDEPFGSLDALTKQSLQYWFLEMSRQEPRSILLVTHDIREAILLADQIVVLSQRPCRALAQFSITPENRDDAARLEKEIFQKLNTKL